MEAIWLDRSPERVVTYQRVLGGSTNTYYLAVQFDDWSDLDRWQTVPQMLVNAYGQAEATTLLRAFAEWDTVTCAC